MSWDRPVTILMPDRPLDAEEIRKYKEVIRLRLMGTPTAYITGKKAFLKWEFIVTPDVLVPRPETELLVEKAVERVKQEQGSKQETAPSPVSLLDLGTGSGAVAVTLAHYLPDYRIDAVDISPAAVAVAKENARSLGVEEKITFYTGDLFSALPPEKKGGYLGIISNPPYIPSKDWPALSREVRAEPRVALDGGEDGLKVIRDLLRQAGGTIPGGSLPWNMGMINTSRWRRSQGKKDSAGLYIQGSCRPLPGDGGFRRNWVINDRS